MIYVPRITSQLFCANFTWLLVNERVELSCIYLVPPCPTSLMKCCPCPEPTTRRAEMIFFSETNRRRCIAFIIFYALRYARGSLKKETRRERQRLFACSVWKLINHPQIPEHMYWCLCFVLDLSNSALHPFWSPSSPPTAFSIVCCAPHFLLHISVGRLEIR